MLVPSKPHTIMQMACYNGATVFQTLLLTIIFQVAVVDFICSSDGVYERKSRGIRCILFGNDYLLFEYLDVKIYHVVSFPDY